MRSNPESLPKKFARRGIRRATHWEVTMSLTNGVAVAGREGRRLAGLQHRAFGLEPGACRIRLGHPGGDADHDEDDRADQSDSYDLEVGGAVGANERVGHLNPPRASMIGRDHSGKGS